MAEGGGYSLGERCLSEGIGMTLTIYLGECILANELLARTKGHDMGWVWVALGFAMAFAFPIVMLNYISAKLNPAMLLAHWVYLGWSAEEFFALSACECVGGFLGAILVWLHYLPHFKTVPEPPPKSARESLLRPRDYVGVTGLRVAGYNTADRTTKRGRAAKSFVRKMVADAKYYLDNNAFEPVALKVLDEAEKKTPEGLFRRRSVQVADLHRRLEEISDSDFVAPLGSKLPRSASDVGPRTDFGDLAATPEQSFTSPPEGSQEASAEEAAEAEKLKEPLSYSDAIFEAALIADQNAKLSIFATRPAIYSPVFNFLAEFLATTALIAGALFIDERGKMLFQSVKGLWPTLNGLYIGFFIFVFVLGFGGPTGVAANIARDTAPRLAHFILPIPNKGPSEWYYSWIPAVASLCGGLVGGGIFTLFNMLNQSNIPQTAADAFVGF